MNEAAVLGARRVLLLAPHPDDEALACGGTLARLAAAGAEIEVAFVSDGLAIDTPGGGSADALRAVRRAEAEAAARVLGVQSLRFLGFPDGALGEHLPAIERAIAARLGPPGPDLLLAPSPLDGHPDHQAVARLAIAAARRSPALQLALYQVYGTLRFDTLIDIEPVLRRKREAIGCYRTSLFERPEAFAEAEEGLARFWAFFRRAPGHHEALLTVARGEALSEPDVLAWLTHGAAAPDPAIRFLDQLRAADELLWELRRSEEALERSDAEVRRLEQQLAAMRGTRAWRLATEVVRVRDALRRLAGRRR